ncbi:MAG: hypothetical protein OEY27_03890 [Gammaproteobacteria bacterium]|nr:hypothetical protein [Gammaproteobacteria bacterium]
MPQITIQKLQMNGWPEDGDLEEIDEELLSYSTGLVDDDREYTVWEEWRLEGKIVKRRAHVAIKKGMSTGIELQIG